MSKECHQSRVDTFVIDPQAGCNDLLSFSPFIEFRKLNKASCHSPMPSNLNPKRSLSWTHDGNQKAGRPRVRDNEHKKKHRCPLFTSCSLRSWGIYFVRISNCTIVHVSAHFQPPLILTDKLFAIHHAKGTMTLFTQIATFTTNTMLFTARQSSPVPLPGRNHMSLPHLPPTSQPAYVNGAFKETIQVDTPNDQ
ncbi:hypothetical protein BC829DRAFT_35164 [Chytridium lagenaria]|nr:hypothetical protein BC829DRAFT_35164 [Chytridium lagenaria]